MAAIPNPFGPIRRFFHAGLCPANFQHFLFCKRQWVLIHVEQLWSENYLTTAGHLEYERAHDYASSESSIVKPHLLYIEIG